MTSFTLLGRTSFYIYGNLEQVDVRVLTHGSFIPVPVPVPVPVEVAHVSASSQLVHSPTYF